MRAKLSLAHLLTIKIEVQIVGRERVLNVHVASELAQGFQPNISKSLSSNYKLFFCSR